MTSRDYSWSVAVPTIRPEQFISFLAAWDKLFTDYKVNLIVMQDAAANFPEIEAIIKNRKYSIQLLNWSHIKLETIPRQTDMVRSWAIFEAWKTKADFTLTLDDDVRPIGDIFREYEAVFAEGRPQSEYLDVGALTSSGLQMRGFPFKDRKPQTVVVQYGGWNNVLDLDARTQLKYGAKKSDFAPIVMTVPKGAATTCCIMNCAFRREYTPIFWQLPLLDGKYNRAGDIWSGLFIKRTLDAIGAVMVINGKASVEHIRASDPHANLKKEAPGYKFNENLWQVLPSPATRNTIKAYRQVTDMAAQYFSEQDAMYSKYFLKARNDWLSLFKD